MRIVVCLKEVLDPDAVNAYAVGGRLTISEDGRAIAQASIPRLMNAYDEQAIEAALQVKESGADAEILAVSIGGTGDHLKRAAAMGLTDLTHIQADSSQLDSAAVASILAAFVASRGGADLVLCGRQASDDDQGVVPGILAETLGVPVVAMAREVKVSGNAATIRRVTPIGDELVRVGLPAVVTITSEFGVPRYPTAAGMMAARRVKPTVTSVAELGADLGAPKVRLERMFVPEVQGNCEFIQGASPAEIAAELVRRLRAEGGDRVTGPIVVASVGDGSRGGFTDTIEVVAAVARGLADAQGARVHWAVPGALASAARQQAGTLGVDQVDAIGGGDWSPAGPDAAVEALAAFAAARSPGVILLAQTFEGRLTAARLGARLRAAVLTNALEVKAAGSTLEVTASAFGGDVRAIYSVDASGLVILTVLPAATGAAAGGAREVSFEELAAPSAGSDRVEILEPAESTGPRLEEAKIVVSGGRGLGKVENYHLVEELAAALGGIAGASRPIVDEGWVDSSRQVGLTGRITRPDLYFAAGISGASQHMAGCSASRVIVAVNTDQQAPIFRYARFGVVADCLEILPAVTKAVKDKLREPGASASRHRSTR